MFSPPYVFGEFKPCLGGEILTILGKKKTLKKLPLKIPPLPLIPSGGD
jgi:hypothetical protein